MPKPRRIILIAFDGVELLDLSGPSAVFSSANTLSGKQFYEIIVAAAGTKNITSGCGIRIEVASLKSIRFGKKDTVLALGAEAKPLFRAIRSSTIQDALKTASRKAERYGAVCAGSFLLGASGVIDGKRVTTHWSARDRLAKLFDRTEVDGDSLYVQDGRLWTSAGITAGIDMSLAMLEADHGAQLKSQVAKHLVVYAHRPGHQSQFSDMLIAQVRSDETYGKLIDWLNNRLHKKTKVADMADYLNMSERTFYRQFTVAFSETPSKFFEYLRLDASRVLLEASQPVSQVCRSTGFRSEAAFRSAFKNRFGVTPSHHARMHRRPSLQ